MRRILTITLLLVLLLSSSVLAQRTLVVVHLRGGFDSLYAVQPYGEKIALQRPYLFQESGDLTYLPARSGVLREGVHQEFPELVNAINDDDAVIVHQVGYNSTTSASQLGYKIVTRGVVNPTSNEKRGWLQRIAQVNGLNSGNMIDLSAKSSAFDGGDFEPTRAYGLTNVDNFNGSYRHHYDQTFQLTTLAVLADSAKNPGYKGALTSLMTAAPGFSDALNRISWPSVSGRGSSTVYPNDSLGYRLREAEVLIRTTNAEAAKVIYIELEGFDTYRYQRWSLRDRIQDLNDAIRTFRARMKATGKWNDTILAVIADGGRSIGEAGEEPEDGRADRAYGVGTNFGGAFDVYLFSGALRGGGVLGGYTDAEMSRRYVSQKYHLLDVYQELMDAVGYQTAGAFESYPRRRLKLF
jgi:uncharacterized protein (DUF1501 family)